MADLTYYKMENSEYKGEFVIAADFENEERRSEFVVVLDEHATMPSSPDASPQLRVFSDGLDAFGLFIARGGLGIMEDVRDPSEFIAKLRGLGLVPEYAEER
jgi:hypothetical protein